MRPRASSPIGVFDSGVGGLSVLRALMAQLPREDFTYFADTGHAPYGERGDGYVADRSLTITNALVAEHGIKALVVACNTATAATVHLLREAYPQMPIVGVEPALKPAAALTKTKRVAVFATRGTLGSAKFAALRDSLSYLAAFTCVPCDGLAAAIEAGDATKIEALCAVYMRAAGRFGSENEAIDTLVLGCTHYPFAADVLQQLAGEGVTLVETGEPVARQTRRKLEEHALLNDAGQGRVEWLTTGSMDALRAAARRWLAL
jgi:glutamate racemase